MAKTSQLFRLAASLLVVCATGVAPATAAPGKGYLAALGPAPLRFLPPHTAAITVMLLPPMGSPDAHKTAVASQTTNAPAPLEPVAAPAGASTNLAVSPAVLAPAPTNAPLNAVAPLAPPAEIQSAPDAGIIDPRFILGYLIPPASNSLPANLVLPSFIPPDPPRSSKATYESR
jgi:hypothetical protein